MLKNLTKICFVLALVIGLPLSTASEPISFSLLREDGSLLEGYFLSPKSPTSPIVFAIQGSYCESSFDWFVELKDHISVLGLGLVILEKQGISKNEINQSEYMQMNALDRRIEDHILCIQKMEDYIYPEWNGEFVFFGESEGGMIAGELLSKIPQVKGLILFSAGGGMSVIDETKWAIQKKLEGSGAFEEEIDRFLASFDEKVVEMINNPTPDMLFLGNTYKWWASLLTSKGLLSNLSDLKVPLYLIHGSEDEKIPVQSTDLIVQELSKRGNNRITYQKLNGYDHNLNHPAVMKNALLWLKSHTISEECKDELSLSGKFCFARDLAVESDQTDSQNNQELDWKTAISEYNVTRGRGGAGASVEGGRDSEGNKHVSGGVEVHYETGGGLRYSAEASATGHQDRDGNKSAEAKVKGNIGFDFHD